MNSNNQNSNPLWYKDAIIYQLHVRSFYDSNGDGIGDFKGLIQKLDYVQSLGVNTLWLLPFYPSPLKDGGYDIADFTDIHASYGTLSDFKRFVKEAHKRGLRIITELVLNHTSTEHKWFQRARKAKPGSAYRDFYVWNDDTEKYRDARIIFQDFEVSNWTYDHEAKAYYWHRFYSHQPDLNFENPRVQQEIFKILDFWFHLGVDGFRLDAVPYLFEAEGTNCENLPETHEYLKMLREYVDKNHQDKLLLAEANQWPNDSREYFGDGDECHMAFHFPLMPRMYMALRMEERFPVIDIMEQTPQIPDNCQWAIFLRNHDELTLEMVSDEERDYMYKTFAQDPKKRVNVGIRRRLFPLFSNDTRSIELLNFLLFSMPGTPIVYYGDEIGMGDNYYLGDRDGVRTPMQWSPDKNAGFSHADPQKLFLPVVIDYNYHYTTVNVENQEKHPSSFLWWKRRVISKRKQYKSFGRGSIKFVNSNNPKILAFIRSYEDESILVVVNLSRYSQHVELDLHDYAGSTPMEVFSKNDFPVITDNPWAFSMQFKNYFWFELRKPGKNLDRINESEEVLKIELNAWNRMNKDLENQLKNTLHEFIIKSRWFIGEAKKIKEINFIDRIPIKTKDYLSYLFLVQFNVIDSDKNIYLMPVSIATNAKGIEIKTKNPEALIAPITLDNEEGILYDGAYNSEIQMHLFDLIRKRSKLKGIHGELEGSSGKSLRKLNTSDLPLKPSLLAAKRSNISIGVGDHYFLKLYRSPQEGENPDVEILKNITRQTDFAHIPAYVGRLDYRNPNFENTSIALLTDLIPNAGNAWQWTETYIESFFDKVLSEKDEFDKNIHPETYEDFKDFVGPFFLEMIETLAGRTAQMHISLANLTEEKSFATEEFSLLYQKSLYQSLRTFVKRTFASIKPHIDKLNPEHKNLLQEIINEQDVFFGYIQDVLEKEKIEAQKIRIHGNYKLDKVLFTGKDFIITDFEGEAENPLSVRKLKHCSLKDVAAILSSLHYALNMGYFRRKEFVPVNGNYLRPLMDKWYEKTKKSFLDKYYQEISKNQILPKSESQSDHLLNLFLFEKNIQELKNFIINEPYSIIVPIKSLLDLKKKIRSCS